MQLIRDNLTLWTSELEEECPEKPDKPEKHDKPERPER